MKLHDSINKYAAWGQDNNGSYINKDLCITTFMPSSSGIKSVNIVINKDTLFGLSEAVFGKKSDVVIVRDYLWITRQDANPCLVIKLQSKSKDRLYALTYSAFDKGQGVFPYIIRAGASHRTQWPGDQKGFNIQGEFFRLVDIGSIDISKRLSVREVGVINLLNGRSILLDMEALLSLSNERDYGDRLSELLKIRAPLPTTLVGVSKYNWYEKIDINIMSVRHIKFIDRKIAFEVGGLTYILKGFKDAKGTAVPRSEYKTNSDLVKLILKQSCFNINLVHSNNMAQLDRIKKVAIADDCESVMNIDLTFLDIGDYKVPSSLPIGAFDDTLGRRSMS